MLKDLILAFDAAFSFFCVAFLTILIVGGIASDRKDDDDDWPSGARA